MGSIKYKNYTILIEANGDICIGGFINGEEFYYKDKGNSGRAYREFGNEIDDERLYALSHAPYLGDGSDSNVLIFENNNWFECNLVDPDGNFIDLFFVDNLLSDNILECFDDVSDYFQYVDMEIDHAK